MGKIHYFCIVALLSAMIAMPVSATTYYVDDDGGADFTSISDALNAASSGDTIYVYNGTYVISGSGSVMTNTYVTLTGEGADVVSWDLLDTEGLIIGSNNAGEEADGCIVEGIKFVNSACGIRLGTYGPAPDSIIRNCVFEGLTASNGVEIESDNVTFENNIIANATGGGSGLRAQTVNNCKLLNNTFINSPGTYGSLYLQGAYGQIIGNTFINNDATAVMLVFPESCIVRGNDFTSNGDGVSIGIYEGDNNSIYLNNIGAGSASMPFGGSIPTNTYFNSTEPIEYNYNGATYSGYLGNFWSSAYTGSDAEGNGIGNTPYTIPDGLGTDHAPLMAGYENYLHPNEPQNTPVANFSAVPFSGNAPLAVQFTDLSTGSPTAWAWDFDNDGNVDSTEQNPSYTYNDAGSYTVNLTVTNADGSDSEVKDAYIVVSGPLPEAPVANFTATPTAGNAPLTVNFTDASTGTVSSYAWDFENDGTVDSTEQNPVHTYVAEGNYTVSLTVTSAGGSNSEVKPDYITVSKSYIPAEPGEDWPSFQKDLHNTGLTSDRGPITAPDEEVSWDVYTHGTGMAGIDTVPVVVNGSVYVISTDGHVRAINRTTSALNWETPIPDCSGFQLGNPAYGNGKIFVPTADSRIFAFDAWTGTELWNDSVESNKPSSSSLYHQLNTPVVYDNGRIYFGQWIPSNYAGKYYCYTEDGTEVWNRDCTHGNKGYYWAGATVVGDYLVFGGDDGYLTSLYKVNGTLVDEINIGAGEIRSTLVYDEESNRIFTSTKNGYCISIEMSPEGTFNNSSKVQSASFGAQSTSTPVIYNGRVYLGSGNFQASSPFFCLNSTDLSVIWSFTGTTGGVQSSPVVSTAYDDGDGEVYIYFTTNAKYGRLYCLRDNATNTNMTSEEWYFQPEDSKNQYTLQGVALVGGWLYYGNDKGYLFGLAGVQNESEIPVADFNAAPLSGNSPLTVNFTDDSTGSPTSWSWDFGDGTNSTEQNPSHTYNSTGNYTVSLTVSNDGGSDSEVKIDYITVSSTPVEPELVAAFTADVTEGTDPLTVNFTDQSTGSPTAWEWDFGDGANSTEQNPSHTYVSSGNYTVNLTVENAAGTDFELKSDYIEVSKASGSTVTLYFDPESSSVSENESTEINLVASLFPAGFSGYNLTVALDNPAVAEIVDIEYPSWALITENSTLPGTSIYLKAVDGNNTVKEGAADVVLATLTISGKESGSANLSIGVDRLDDDSGETIEPEFLAGKIEVTLLSPLPDQEYAPKDLDGDGLYEDLTGNGEFSFVDIVAYFHNMDWIEENMPVEYFDFNGNGRIDFDDVVRMFGMI
ncbi:cell surface protein [Methanosarcina siciliae HI350]|uniref:Probable pectate lyase C n=1 Tax=Methanosarcina siciliae HI350 TaxID=1434119 RepID=A0A0E3LBR2_9EURY|nr:PKD domain-containing protein [Methanosarcina siciliae]AKB34216.1 cell surface protein [Methanosarcina siciliae HI350]